MTASTDVSPFAPLTLFSYYVLAILAGTLVTAAALYVAKRPVVGTYSL